MPGWRSKHHAYRHLRKLAEVSEINPAKLIVPANWRGLADWHRMGNELEPALLCRERQDGSCMTVQPLTVVHVRQIAIRVHFVQIWRMFASAVSTTSSMWPHRTRFIIVRPNPCTWSATIWDRKSSHLRKPSVSLPGGREPPRQPDLLLSTCSNKRQVWS